MDRCRQLRPTRYCSARDADWFHLESMAELPLKYAAMNFVRAIAILPRIAAKMATLDSDAMRGFGLLCEQGLICASGGQAAKYLYQRLW
jgi:hypothetical protein